MLFASNSVHFLCFFDKLYIFTFINKITDQEMKLGGPEKKQEEQWPYVEKST